MKGRGTSLWTRQPSAHFTWTYGLVDLTVLAQRQLLIQTTQSILISQTYMHVCLPVSVCLCVHKRVIYRQERKADSREERRRGRQSWEEMLTLSIQRTHFLYLGVCCSVSLWIQEDFCRILSINCIMLNMNCQANVFNLNGKGGKKRTMDHTLCSTLLRVTEQEAMH